METIKNNVQPPADYTQDIDDPNLYWGPRSESATVQLLAYWTTEHGFGLEIENRSSLTIDASLEYASMIAGIAASIKETATQVELP